MTGDVIIDGLTYPIVLADDAAATLPRTLGADCRSAVIVYDRRVEVRAQAIAASLAASGRNIKGSLSLVGGETLKRSSTVAGLYDRLLELGAGRSTTIVAVGGGTVTDVAGYTAATYLRGVPWIAIPTTVLGMADAAIGGKTGIDLPQGKNLVGAFWNPAAVVADVKSLATLPARERGTGLAEAVKCAIIGDPALLEEIDRVSLQAEPHLWKTAIAGAAQVKVRIVASDPTEQGPRALLNLGHTVGHAIEIASDFRVAHGAAVSIGLRAEALIARSQDWWPASDHARMLGSLEKAGLPLYVEDLSADNIMKAMSLDKKSIDGRIRFVLPVAIGDVRHGIEVSGPIVRAAVEACFSRPPASEWSS